MVGVGVLLAMAVLLVFGQTLRYDFVNYDDDQYFYTNPQVQNGSTWSGVTWAFQATHAANRHPLTWLSLMLDAQLFGVGPAGPHLSHVLLHAAKTAFQLYSQPLFCAALLEIWALQTAPSAIFSCKNA
jgi:protein O-mannosyl-transferase